MIVSGVKARLSGMALATGSWSWETPAASALPLTATEPLFLEVFQC